MDRTRCPAWGLAGGGSAKISEVEIHGTDGSVRRVLKGNHLLNPGDRVVVRSAGGGGHGPAWERDIDQVRADVEFGYVTIEGAASDYGVCIRRDGSVDIRETHRLRQLMATIRRQENG